MKKIIKNVLIKLVKMFSPIFRFLALHSDIKVINYLSPNGEHPLIFKDSLENVKHNVPKSTYFNTRSGKIVIGKNTVFGENVMLLTGKHNYYDKTEKDKDLHKVPEYGRDITIGDNCYVGSGAIIIGPVRIHDFSVICAGAVVLKDTEMYSMVGGVPAKRIKSLKN